MARFSVVVPPNHGNGSSRQSRADRRKREQLFAKQNGNCYWCGGPMSLTHFHVTTYGRRKQNPAFASFEHLLPKSHGGASGFVNIVLAHIGCNNARARKKWPHDPVYGSGDRKQLADKKRIPPKPKSEPRNRIKPIPIAATMDILSRSRMLTKIGVE